MPKPKTDTSPSFEQAIERLEDIVDRIESGEVGLEQALEQYEQGQKLIQHCRGVLDKAERRIAELTRDAAGRPVIGESDAGIEGDKDRDTDERG